jgi:hypothetical protein
MRISAGRREPPGHLRAINPGDERSLTVTRGHPAPAGQAMWQARTAQIPKADSAGSIPVTRSNTKAQVRTTVSESGPCCFTVATAFRAIS